MLNKTYLYFGLVIIAVVAIAGVLVNRGYDSGDSLLSPTPTPTPTPVLSESPTPVLIPSSSSTPKPSPQIIIEEKNYAELALKFDEDGNRRLVLNENCSALVPSQVAYKNNVQIMLDNTYSSQPHILKIGSREYSLKAGEWFLTTLSSPTVPASLTIFCGAMELGQIDLN